MNSDIARYVEGCDRCQRYKPAKHPKATLTPQETPDAPWTHIGVDMIGPLLTTPRKHDAITVYVDHFTDQVHLAPCRTTLTAEGAADLHYREVFRHHGLPRKVFSDRGPQYAAHFMRSLYK